MVEKDLGRILNELVEALIRIQRAYLESMISGGITSYVPVQRENMSCRDIVRAVLSEILVLLDSGKVDEAKKKIREMLEEVYGSEST